MKEGNTKTYHFLAAFLGSSLFLGFCLLLRGRPFLWLFFGRLVTFSLGISFFLQIFRWEQREGVKKDRYLGSSRLWLFRLLFIFSAIIIIILLGGFPWSPFSFRFLLITLWFPGALRNILWSDVTNFYRATDAFLILRLKIVVAVKGSCVVDLFNDYWRYASPMSPSTGKGD